MPICNEDVNRVFAGLRATWESVKATGNAKHFDVYILSDSYNRISASQSKKHGWSLSLKSVAKVRFSIAAAAVA